MIGFLTRGVEDMDGHALMIEPCMQMTPSTTSHIKIIYKLTEGSKIKIFVSGDPPDASLPPSVLVMPGKCTCTKNKLTC